MALKGATVITSEGIYGAVVIGRNFYWSGLTTQRILAIPIKGQRSIMRISCKAFDLNTQISIYLCFSGTHLAAIAVKPIEGFAGASFHKRSFDQRLLKIPSRK